MTGEWQSPETAPKDGSLFIGYGTFVRGSRALTLLITHPVSWREVKPKPDQYEPVEGDLYRKIESAPTGMWTACDFELLAWMPFPDPPANLGATDGR